MHALRFRPARGFTLVEILAALLVLLFGLASVMVLMYGGFKEGRAASDRNAASVIIPEAARAIEQECIIDSNTQTSYGLTANTLGMFVQTLQTAPESDKKTPFSSIQVGSGTLAPPSTLAATNLNQWPRSGPYLFGGDKTSYGSAYYVRYRLEKHPDWCTGGVETSSNVNSVYRGVYVLTLVVYSVEDRPPAAPVYKQVSDPTVTYLKDRKVR